MLIPAAPCCKRMKANIFAMEPLQNLEHFNEITFHLASSWESIPWSNLCKYLPLHKDSETVLNTPTVPKLLYTFILQSSYNKG